ncbi:MAG: universal stress protein, partial [Chloroflexota bacterium]
LVSMSALVTFVADRAPVLNNSVLGIQYRTFVAVALSLLIGWLVNRGPKVAARAFGPATAGVLVLLWAMVFASLGKYGLRLPDFNLQAFSLDNIELTFGGFTRILAVMTGIEVFANLVAAYDGTPAEKGKKAFGSLMIVMGTAAATMLIVGPTIFDLSNPLESDVSVFTQTMDALLPAPLPYFGTLIGIAVLMSACAASAQGLQNLALGLRERHYIPPALGHRNQYEVADKPVWIEVGLSCVMFVLFGTHEETYLAIYAAGVFVLLSMTGWAASKRLLREMRKRIEPSQLMLLAGTVAASLLTSGATVLIFKERFMEGAWTYMVLVPVLYSLFSYFRGSLGTPSPAREAMGEIHGGLLGGFGLGQAISQVTRSIGRRPEKRVTPPDWQPSPKVAERLKGEPMGPAHVVVPLDGSSFAEQALPFAQLICTRYKAKLSLVSAFEENATYLERTARRMQNGYVINTVTGQGSVTETVGHLVNTTDADLVITTSRGASGARHWISRGVAHQLVCSVNQPVLVIQPRNGEKPRIDRLLVSLDQSEFAERVLPYARALAAAFSAEVLLLSVPEVPEADKFGVAPDEVSSLRNEAEENLWRYLTDVAAFIRSDEVKVRTLVQGTYPTRTIVDTGKQEKADIIMLSTHGRGGLNRLIMGSAAERVMEQTEMPVFLLPVRD